MDAQARRPATTALTHRETMLVVLGVLLPVFMGSLDNTILASALPTIGREFGDVHNLPWLITAYLIANTAVTALYGKISDIHGRRTTLLIAISLYMAGLAGLRARAEHVRADPRAACCTGSAAAASPRPAWWCWATSRRRSDRGKYYGYFSATYTTAGACGPALGGFIAEYLHWSVIFWMNIPLGLIAIALTLTLLQAAAAARAAAQARLPRRVPDHDGERRVHAGAQHGRRALSLDVAADPRAVRARAGRRRRASCGGCCTAPEPLIPLAILVEPRRAACDRRQRVRLGRRSSACTSSCRSICRTSSACRRRSPGLSVLMLAVALNISAGVTGTILPRREHYKTDPDRRAWRSRSPRCWCWRGGAQTMIALEFEIAAVRDRHRLRRHAAAVRDRAAEQRVDPHLRLRGRHHAVLAQPLRHHDGRGVRRHGAGRRWRAAGAASAAIPSRASCGCSSPPPRASRSR